MTVQAYEHWNPNARSIELIDIANEICAEMAEDGYDLTLRQLYYQFVSRDVIPNTERSYKNLGTLVDKARRAGLLDWDYIEDRTRNLRGFNHTTSPAEVIRQSQWRFAVDHWRQAETRVEVWVEKEALVSVIARPANRWDVDYFACKGYVSQSEMRSAAERHIRFEDVGQRVVVIHLGDHDPSGIDMSRDIADRLHLFEAHTEVRRIALNMDQIDEYEPPPNPAKLSDSRAADYIERFGDSSWELDALPPAVIDDLVSSTILQYVEDSWDDAHAEQATGRELLALTSDRWADVVELLEGEP